MIPPNKLTLFGLLAVRQTAKIVGNEPVIRFQVVSPVKFRSAINCANRSISWVNTRQPYPARTHNMAVTVRVCV